MRLSTRSIYGIRALVELALASGRGPVSAAAIAKRQELSIAYLEQLLHRLRKRGLLGSIRGPRGGYVLAGDPARITMADVVGVLDGERGWSGDARNGAGRGARRAWRHGGRSRLSPSNGKDAHRHAQRIARAVWRCVHERLAQSLGAITLQDLCDEVRAASGGPLDHRYVFHI
jgi:Rrf2 family iron-sulfur cluster assembly transcriptional regulator